jgi:hypothetical protein
MNIDKLESLSYLLSELMDTRPPLPLGTNITLDKEGDCASLYIGRQPAINVWLENDNLVFHIMCKACGDPFASKRWDTEYGHDDEPEEETLQLTLGPSIFSRKPYEL